MDWLQVMDWSDVDWLPIAAGVIVAGSDEHNLRRMEPLSVLGRKPINLIGRTACESPLCTNSDRIAATPRNDAMGP